MGKVLSSVLGNARVFFFDNQQSVDCVLVFPDAFGPSSGHIHAICASLSKAHKVVLMDLVPDYLADTSNAAPWLKRFPFDDLVVQIDAVTNQLKARHNVKLFAAMGFCWGAWIAAKLSTRSPDFLCGVSFHPSWGIDEVFNGPGSGLKMAQDLLAPQLVLTAGDDSAWLKPNGQVDAILRSKAFAPSRFREFPNMHHGWMSRGNLEDPSVAAAFHTAWSEEATPFLSKAFASPLN